MSKKNKFYCDIMAFHEEVTGSCILVNVIFPNKTSKKILVDCGFYQETDYINLNSNLPFNPEGIDYVLVTHNHADHTGRLPLLLKKGYNGKIHMSITTSKLISKALEDNYKIIKLRSKVANEPLLYTDSDVTHTMEQIEAHPYNESIWLDNNIKLTFFMNGHLPGAVCILMQIKYRDYSNQHYPDINLFFTGDYNNKNVFFKVPRIPKWVHQLPITVIQEATYGDMDSTSIEYIFEKNILSAVAEKKEILVPVFSLGRCQEIMYILKCLQLQGKLDVSIPIYLDGHLAMSYTNIYKEDGLDISECRDFIPENLTYITDTNTRTTIISDNNCKIILSTSGMGSYGPCQTYLPIFIKRENVLIHFTGYCAENTLGRKIFDTVKNDKVNIAGLQVIKKADVKFTSEFSAHAKADELIQFLKDFEDLKFVLINHGSFDKKRIYANRVIDEVKTKDDPAILGRDYFYRVDGYGFVKSVTTKFH